MTVSMRACRYTAAPRTELRWAAVDVSPAVPSRVVTAILDALGGPGSAARLAVDDSAGALDGVGLGDEMCRSQIAAVC